MKINVPLNRESVCEAGSLYLSDVTGQSSGPGSQSQVNYDELELQCKSIIVNSFG